jgi:uncharacterized membrane protein YfcA
VIEIPDSATFAAVLADRRFLIALAIATISGLVRGFSGFGSALIYMPLIAAVYDPRIAAVTLLLVDFTCSTPFVIGQLRRCTWSEVTPISIAMVVTVPLGTWLLVVLDPIVLRWAISILVLSLVVVLISGWRYRGPSTLPITTGVGFIAGIGAGAAQIAGPPVILYWMSRGNNAATLRANLMVFFLICSLVLCGAGPVHRTSDRARDAVRADLHHRRGDRRAKLSRGVRPALPQRRLCDLPAGGAAQPAAARSDITLKPMRSPWRATRPTLRSWHRRSARRRAR